MAGPKVRVETAETEAAAWHARLGATPVSTETIEEFFAWRKTPANADAYRRVEQVWKDAGGLKDDPLIVEALDAALSRRPAARKAGPVLRGAMAMAVAGVAAAALAFGVWSWSGARDVYATSVGEQRLVQLADGSSVRLDTASRVRVRFDGSRRLVDLEAGQALFTVSHDPGRPFVVSAGAAQVTAIGTVFEVRRDDGAVRVVLVSGAVEVKGGEGGEGRRILPGHRAEVTGGAVRTGVADVAAETSWTEGRVVFRETPLKQAVAEVNRYLTDGIELDAPGVENEAVSGVFRTGDRDAFVSAASAALGLKASAGEGGAVRLSAEK